MPTITESLAQADFDRLRELIYAECGINLGPEKKTMLEIRLRRRLQGLACTSYADYCHYLFSEDGGREERLRLIDVVTTNKTDFFREPGHFDYLVSTALPDLAARKGVARRCLIWSAGCSTGEEPYSLAMVVSAYAGERAGFRFAILATDICTEVLQKASLGVYPQDAARPIPADFRRKYLMRSRDPHSGLLRVVPELRSLVEFRRLNLMDSAFGLPDAPEVIFCRNVIIYFDRPTQERLLKKMVRELAPGGYFFAGHSESLQAMDLPLVQVAPSIYRRHP